jgi:outer membrane receptor protein involved in Fe transport
LYFNAGTGFHSNDARATLTTINQQTSEASDTSPGLVRARGAEIGLRTVWTPKLQSAFSLYQLNFDSELNFVGDAGTTEAGRPSKRVGIEMSHQYQVNQNVSVDLEAAFAHARSRGQQAEGNYITGAVEGVAQAAINIQKIGAWSGALRLRYFGPRPLMEDNSVRSKSSTTLNGRIAYQFNPKLRIELEGFNLANRQVSAIDYYYASQLKDEASPKENIHFHPIEPRYFRVMLVKQF